MEFVDSCVLEFELLEQFLQPGSIQLIALRPFFGRQPVKKTRKDRPENRASSKYPAFSDGFKQLFGKFGII